MVERISKDAPAEGSGPATPIVFAPEVVGRVPHAAALTSVRCRCIPLDKWARRPFYWAGEL